MRQNLSIFSLVLVKISFLTLSWNEFYIQHQTINISFDDGINIFISNESKLTRYCYNILITTYFAKLSISLYNNTYMFEAFKNVTHYFITNLWWDETPVDICFHVNKSTIIASAGWSRLWIIRETIQRWDAASDRISSAV